MALDLGNISQQIAGLVQLNVGAGIAASGADAQASTIIQGGEISAQGSLFSAAGFRQSARSVGQATQFNLGIQSINHMRDMSNVSRQFRLSTGKQMVQQAVSGVSLTSKSFLMTQAETSNTFQQALLNLQVDFTNQRRSAIFKSEVQQANLENQARGAEFQAAVTRTQASNRAAEASFKGELAQFGAIQKTIKGATSLIGQVLDTKGK